MKQRWATPEQVIRKLLAQYDGLKAGGASSSTSAGVRVGRAGWSDSTAARSVTGP